MEEKEVVKKDDSLLPDTFIVHNDLLINYTDEDSNNDLIIPISSHMNIHDTIFILQIKVTFTAY